jgi:hypothetical protein
MAVPIIYGLYLLAGVAGRAGAKYGIKKVVKNATGRLLSRHKTKALANTEKNKVTTAATSGSRGSYQQGQQMLANAQAKSGIAAAARQAARNATKTKPKPPVTKKPQETSRPPPLGDTKAAQQTLAGARYQSAAGAGSRRANPTGAARPQVRAGGGGAGGRPPSKVAVGAGLGLVGGGIGAAALVAKKQKEQKEKAKASPQAKKAMNKAAAALSQSKIKNKPKPPFRNTNSRTTKALNQGLSAPPKPKFDPEGIKERLASRKSGKLKTSLRAARAAGDLYYKNLKTGKKMVAVIASDLKPGQSLTQYVNKKENKTPRTPIPRRKPTQKPIGL